MKLILQMLQILCLSAFMNNAYAGLVSLYLTPNSTKAAPGETVSFDVMLSGLGNLSASSLGAFDIDVHWDDSKLNFQSGILSTNLFTTFSDTLAETMPGVLNLSQLSLETPDFLNTNQPGKFSLASLDFQVISLLPLQSTSVGFGQVSLADENGDTLEFRKSTASVTNGTPVPAPPILLLLMVGLLPVFREWLKRAIVL